MLRPILTLAYADCRVNTDPGQTRRLRFAFLPYSWGFNLHERGEDQVRRKDLSKLTRGKRLPSWQKHVGQ